MDLKDILYTTDGPVATITLNRPRYKNAQSYRMLDEIDAGFRLAKNDKDIRALIIRGSGGNFSSGHDLGTRGCARLSQVAGREARASKPMTSSRNTISIFS